MSAVRTKLKLDPKEPMGEVADPPPVVSALCPALGAAVLLVARDLSRRLGLAHPSAAQVLEATAAGRSRAYELREALLGLLPSLQRRVGRPAASQVPAPCDDPLGEFRDAVLDFIMAHPGCVRERSQRRRYSDQFRRFVLELRERHAGLELDTFAAAIRVPLGTVKDWLRVPAGDSTTEASALVGGDCELHEGTEEPAAEPMSAHIQTVLNAWDGWQGGFVDFCEHVQVDCRVPFGRTFIGHILEASGVRLPRRRPGRSPDEEALRGSFETFFGGAQWVGDGSPIDVVINAQSFGFNLELMVDTFSDGFVGISVRDEEDSQAVVEAFDDGLDTTGEEPLSVLLDNRPSNHTDEVDERLGDTIRIRATKGRPQNKAHAEGGFGLFQQSVPPLVINASNERELARQILALVTQTWGRTGNHLPRRDRGGRSRVELYFEQPTEEQITQARAALEERCRKQLLARQTLEARQDPAKHRLLDEAFGQLGLDDPERHIRIGIARYPLDAIVDGIATFKGKRNAGTLPDGVDGRYLLGIVKNLADQDEGLAIADALWHQRLAQRDSMLAGLQQALEVARATASEPRDLVFSLLDLALDSRRRIDRLFWLDAVAETIRDDSPEHHAVLYRRAAQRIHTTFRLTHRDRLEAVRILASKIAPIQ